MLAAAACCAQNQTLTNNINPSAIAFPCFAFQEGSFKVTFKIETNWVTLHEEPLNKTNTNGPSLCHQAGQVVSNNIAVIVWNGMTNRVALESVPLDLAVLPQRTITNHPETIFTNNSNFHWNPNLRFQIITNLTFPL